MRKSFSARATLLAILIAAGCSLGSAQAAPTFSADTTLGDKLNLPIYEWSDASVPRKGIIVAVHGLTFYAAAYDKLATYLASNGYAVYAADLRGFGRWKTEGKKFGGDDQIHFTQSKDDLMRLVAQLRKDNPNEQIICLGESLGANYAFWALSDENGSLFDAAVVCSPGVKTRIHPHPRMAIDFFRGLRHPNKRLNLEPYITPYLSSDKTITERCLQDKSICRDLSPVELIKAHFTNKRAIEHVERISANLPIMIFAGQNDQVFKTSALPAFAKRIGSRNVSIHTLPEKGHLLLESQEVDLDLRDALDIWLATNTRPTMEAENPSGGLQTSHFAVRVPVWLTSMKRYSPLAMARNSLHYARDWAQSRQ